MPSPFPGMNPYLEHPEVWHDFHERFIPRLADLLDAQVGSGYLVKIDEHIYVQELDDDGQRKFFGKADVSVAETTSWPAKASGGTATLEAPAQVVPVLVDEVRECFIEIRDRQNRALVTVIELLSPANKSGSDRHRYLLKRNEILKSPAHLVEIDLLRGGQWMPFVELPPCDYYVMVSRAAKRPKAGLWPLHLREPLSEIPVPLKPGDADVRLNLQQLVQQLYDAAGYAKYIYDNDLTPALSDDDASWAAAFLQGVQRR